MDKFDMLEEIRKYMSDTQILDELMDAMSSNEAKENLIWIAKMWDIGGFDDEQ